MNTGTVEVWLRHWMDFSGQLHYPPGNPPPVPAVYKVYLSFTPRERGPGHFLPNPSHFTSHVSSVDATNLSLRFKDGCSVFHGSGRRGVEGGELLQYDECPAEVSRSEWLVVVVTEWSSGRCVCVSGCAGEDGSSAVFRLAQAVR
jgi:hypothetical protein